MEIIKEAHEGNFLFVKSEDGVFIKEYTGNAATVVLPNELEGRSVVKLENYSFHEHRELQEVFLPFELKEIGSHAFYNCRNLLKVSMGDSISSMGDGAFKNCSKIKEIEIHRIHGRMSSLHNMLGELNQELLVTILEQKSKAVLIFPYYMHDFEENTPARIVTQVTVGAGVFYRECVTAETVDYMQYDNTFEKAIYKDVSESIYKIALYRRLYPFHLSEKNRKIYDDYIMENKKNILKNLLEQDQMDLLTALLQTNLFSRNEINEFAEIARSANHIRAVGLILEYQRKNFGTVKKTFDF